MDYIHNESMRAYLLITFYCYKRSLKLKVLVTYSFINLECNGMKRMNMLTNRKSYRQVDTPPLPLHSGF